jgi:hypothetical protein
MKFFKNSLGINQHLLTDRPNAIGDSHSLREISQVS